VVLLLGGHFISGKVEGSNFKGGLGEEMVNFGKMKKIN